MRLYIFAALLLAAGPVRADEEKLLRIYNWTDYTAPALVKKFEAETGITVSIDTYDSNETLLAKLKSGGGGYDIAVASSDFVQVLQHEKLLEEIDAATLPNFSMLEPRWQKRAWDPGARYSTPWQWGVTSYQVDTAVYKGPTDSLKALFEPPAEFRGKVGMFSSPSEVISLALVYLGKPPCSSDAATLKQVDALLEKQKPWVKVYNSDGLRERQVSGETVFHQAWNGDALRGRLEKSTLTYVFPKEGAVGWMDNLIVPKGAAHPANAKVFIDFFMKPENAAINSNFTGYQNGSAGSDKFLDAKYSGAPEFNPPADLKLAWTPTCPEDATRKYDLIWTRLRK